MAGHRPAPGKPDGKGDELIRNMPAINRKLFWLAFWVIGFAVFMTGLLLYFKYQSVFTGLQRDRVLMVAGEIDDIAEKSLSLGQDFWEISTLQEVIERRRNADRIFLGIEVAGSDGKIAYATDLARIGSALPPEWLAVFARSSRFSSLSPSPSEAVVASTIRNSFAQGAGYAVIRYSRQPEQEAMLVFTRRLLLICVTVFAVFTMLLYVTLAWLWARTDRELVRAADALFGEVDTLSQPHSHALAADVAEIRKQIAAAQKQLAIASPEAMEAQA
ncbi:MAG: hypothetical protein ABI905_13990 [Betaproteobacteria bacterium]